MSENFDNNNLDEIKNENPNIDNIGEEIPLIIGKKEEPSGLVNSNAQVEQSKQNYVYRWSANDEANFKTNANANEKSNSSAYKKPKKNFGIKIFAAVMSLMFLVSASVTGYMIISRINNSNNPSPVLSNKDAVAETKNNAGNNNTNTKLEDTVITIPDNSGASSKILSTEEAIAKVNPSVVCIQTESQASASDYGYGGFGGFFGGGGSSSQPYTVQGVGTGFIVSEDGYIATNYHVVQDATKITVTLFSGETYDAQFIGGDAVADLAVIKINAKNLKVVEFGDSDSLVIGNDVAAIGTPAGIEFGWTATKGIVSAVARKIDINSRKTMTVIQTDASINPGNSGGPLINMKGQVIGINSMKLASSQYEGMGFAIPINGAIEVLNGIIQNPGVINQDPTTTDTSNVSLGLSGTTFYDQVTGEAQGWKIAEIVPGGPCDGSGLQPSDIIVALDGTAVTTTEDLYALKTNYKPGDKVTITILRNGDNYDFTITLAAKTQ